MSSLFERRKEKLEKKQSSTYKYENHLVDELVDHYKARLLRDTNLEVLTQLTPGEMRLRIEQYVSHFMSEERVIISKNDKDLLITRILDEAVGFGPLEPLINDPDITEILINGFDEVYIEKKGRLETVDVSLPR